jgi:hypothetical protein
MGRFKTAGLRRQSVKIDLHAMFVEAGRRIVRNAGALEAYRKSTGFALRTLRTMEAAESLKEAQNHCQQRYNFIGGERGARHHASSHAMCHYLGKWWATELCDAAPASLGDGDEWFSRKTVRAMIENWADPIPDATGRPSDKWAMPKIAD